MFARFRSVASCAACLALVLLFAQPGTAGAAGHVTDVLWSPVADGGQLQVVAAGDVVFTVANLAGPDRLVIDCLGGEPRRVLPPSLPADGPVRAVTVESRDTAGAPGTRLICTLAAGWTYSHAPAPGTSHGHVRLRGRPRLARPVGARAARRAAGAAVVRLGGRRAAAGRPGAAGDHARPGQRQDGLAGRPGLRDRHRAALAGQLLGHEHRGFAPRDRQGHGQDRRRAVARGDDGHPARPRLRLHRGVRHHPGRHRGGAAQGGGGGQAGRPRVRRPRAARHGHGRHRLRQRGRGQGRAQADADQARHHRDRQAHEHPDRQRHPVAGRSGQGGRAQARHAHAAGRDQRPSGGHGPARLARAGHRLVGQQRQGRRRQRGGRAASSTRPSRRRPARSASAPCSRTAISPSTCRRWRRRTWPT